MQRAFFSPLPYVEEVEYRMGDCPFPCGLYWGLAEGWPRGLTEFGGWANKFFTPLADPIITIPPC